MRSRGFLFGVGLVTAGLVPRSPAAITAQPDADGVTFTLPGAVLRLQVWTDRVIRVTCAPGAALPELKSLCVVARPQAVKWDFRETPADFVISTASAQARVDRQSGAVSFRDATGAMWLAEAPAGRGFSPTPVKDLDARQAEQDFVLAPDEAIFGLGQQETGPWNYRGQTVRLLQSNKNIALPVLVSSRGYGILWDNPAITTVAVGAAGRENVVTWTSEVARAIDYYFLAGPDLDSVVAGYRELTGAAPMFGKWVFGFWQCREHYETQAEILGVLARYRKRGTPIDGVIQDWQYWTPKPWGSHDFDPARYPDPAAMVAQIHAAHAHVIISVWARFDVGCENLRQLKGVNGVFDPVYPNVWPKGDGQWYDAFSADARRVYWRQISQKLFALGFDGWWLDATEPELGGRWGEIRDLRTAMGRGAFVADAYPLMTTTGVYQGQLAETPLKRVFILTRSAWAGQQRNAAISWSGDIHGTWEVFRQQIPAGLNFSLSGIPYWNTDIGGFFGGKTSDPKYAELFTRWFQFGAFCPLFRVHGTGDGKEMWRWDAATDAILVKFDELRYRLLPYIYSTAWQVTHAGDTMLRPLVMDFRTDPRAAAVSDQYLFGRAILVSPVTTAGATSRKVYLPAGADWYDFWSGRRTAGGQTVDAPAPLDTLPLYVKAGSILPLGPVVQYAEEKPAAPLELRVYRGADGAFTLYEDDGNTYDYETGSRSEIPLTWNEAAQQLTIGARRGSFPGMVADREFHVVWVRADTGAGLPETGTADATVKYAGAAVTVAAPAAPAAPAAAAHRIRIVLVGDSTVTDTVGWGLGFKHFLTEGAECINASRGGRSSKSYIDEGLWQKALALKGDYYLFQFGHNDEPGKGPARETDPDTTYPQFMARYVDEARASGARPILVTSLTRRKFDPADPHKLRPSLVPYAAAVRRLAAEKHVPLVDLHARSIALCEALGEAACAGLSARTKEGGIDTTHLNAAGSVAFARLVVEELRRVVPELAPVLRTEPTPLPPAGAAAPPDEPPADSDRGH